MLGLLVLALIGLLVWLLIGLITMPEPVKRTVRIAFVAVCILVLLGVLFGVVPLPRIG